MENVIMIPHTFVLRTANRRDFQEDAAHSVMVDVYNTDLWSFYEFAKLHYFGQYQLL